MVALLSVAIGKRDWIMFGFVLIMIKIASAMQFFQEFRTNVASCKLQASVSSTLEVRRRINGLADHLIIDESALIPGDILLVNAGDALTADCIVLESSGLSVSQSRSAHQCLLGILLRHQSHKVSLEKANPNEKARLDVEIWIVPFPS